LSYAENYYEQLYCEFKAQGQGKNLPDFYNFRRNNEMTQALLLKSIARSNGITLNVSSATSKKTQPSRPAKNLKSTSSPSCLLTDNSINCKQHHYLLAGNKPNEALEDFALESQNKMTLSSFQGNRSHQAAVASYLVDSYEHYLTKMLSIGLGGSTLSYGKFEYLFWDLQKKNVDFSSRFEKMFFYLKQDKKNIIAPAKSSVPEQLTIENCYPINSLWVCSLGMNNYVFVKQAYIL
jgi:hypothetical protein